MISYLLFGGELYNNTPNGDKSEGEWYTNELNIVYNNVKITSDDQIFNDIKEPDN